VQTARASQMAPREMSSTTLAVKSTSLSLEEGAVDDASARVLSWADAQLAGWAILACLSLVLNAQRPELLGGGLKTQLLQSLYPAGQLLGAGVLIGGATWMFRSRGSRSPVWTVVGTWMAGFTLGWTVLKDDLAQIQNRLAHHAPPLFWRALITLGVAASIPVALFLGRFLVMLAQRRDGVPQRRPRADKRFAMRAFVVVLGLALHVIARNHILAHGFPGLHLMLAIAAATLMAGALGGARLPALLGPRDASSAGETGRDDASRRESRVTLARKLAWVLAAIWGACAIFIAPPLQVLFQMLQPPAASVAPFIAELHAPRISPFRSPDEVKDTWSDAPSAPPTTPTLTPRDGVVLLVTIDCFRADLLADDRHAAKLPNLTALRRQSAVFENARSTANYTITALSSLFTGRYESQLAWSDRPTAHTRYRVPAFDPSPRLPEVLAAGGVRSATVTGAEWLDGGSGILRGFTEERDLGPDQGFALAEDLVDASIDIFDHHAQGPLFFYLHLFDAHDPYDRAGTQGTDFERYLGELALVDREVGRLVQAADARFPGRATIIITADHGEAFGEHRSTRHGNTVYEEVVRVPLLIRGPESAGSSAIAPRTIPDAVSTIDLGSTVLDLMHVVTPASFMGRSLAPLLAGESLPPRDVVIESRGYVAIVKGNLKILRRKRYDTLELYDLASDPGERTNLFREDDARSAERLGALDELSDRLNER